MVKRLLVKLIALATLMAGAPFSAQTAAAAPANGWYSSIGGGFTKAGNTDIGGGANLTLGYDLGNQIRPEVELAYHHLPGDDAHGNVTYFNYMGNVYYDFTPRQVGSITPYVGAGAGLASLKRNNPTNGSTKHGTPFAYQGMAGVSYAADQNTDLTLGYRYLGTTRDNIKLEGANSIEIGIRTRFNNF